MVWGSSALRSCASLLEKVERNELEEIVLLSTKVLSQEDWDRLIASIEKHGKDRKLKSIRASGHAIRKETLGSLGKAIHDSSELAEWSILAIGDKDMGSDALQMLVMGLDSPAETLKLGALDLSYKGLSRADLNGLVKLFSRCSHLKHLDLSRNPGMLIDLDAISWEGSYHTTNSMPIFPFVEHLDLTANEMDGLNAHTLLRNLSLTSSCRVLNLSENPVGKQPFDVFGAMPISLCELHLAHCQIDDAALTRLSVDGTPKSCLQTLDFSNNHLSVVSMEQLAEWLASDSSSSLRNLNISANPLTPQGVEILINKGLSPRVERKPQSRLLSLDLSDTGCGTAGALAAVKASPSSNLRLFDNQLGAEGFNALAPYFVGGHAVLESLDLAGNGAPESCVIHLLRGLLAKDTEAGPSKLTTIVVGGNKGGGELETLVQEILKVRPEIDIARDRIRQ